MGATDGREVHQDREAAAFVSALPHEQLLLQLKQFASMQLVLELRVEEPPPGRPCGGLGFVEQQRVERHRREDAPVPAQTPARQLRDRVWAWSLIEPTQEPLAFVRRD
eukprot:5554793-Prymnesium_polylepis.1